MSKIDVISLGGLNENGKNLYTVSVDGKLFVFDAGLKYAPDKMYGIDYIIPGFKYLVENKNRIEGVFISHAHYENMGALTDLVREIPDVKVYATKFACAIINDEAANKDVKIKNLIEISPYKQISFGKVSIFPFSVTHSVPETVSYVINTEDGAIVYMADFLIDPTMDKPYDMDLGKIAYVGKQGVLLLMAESVFSEKQGHTSPSHKLDKFFASVIDKSEGRVIFTVLPLHIYIIQQIFNSIKGTDRKVVIMGKKLGSIVNIAINNGYLKNAEGKIGDLTNLKDPNSILIVSNDRENAYGNLARIVKGYDKFITLKETDTVCFAEPTYDAYELIRSKLMDDIARIGTNIETVPAKNAVRLHASAEDLMLLIKLLNPKYYMPIKGEYRYQVGNAILAENVGMSKDDIFLKGNGEVLKFVNGQHQECFDKVEEDSIIIDGKSGDDLGEIVIKDREVLGDSGLLLVSTTLDKRTKQIIAGPEVLTKGFINIKDSTELLDGIKQKTRDVITSNVSSNYADYPKMKNEIREALLRLIFNKTACKPIILTVIQEI
jgi:ribonuclease J